MNSLRAIGKRWSESKKFFLDLFFLKTLFFQLDVDVYFIVNEIRNRSDSAQQRKKRGTSTDTGTTRKSAMRFINRFLLYI